MLLLKVYEQWRGISVLGENFRAVERGRELCVVILIYLGSAFLSLCCRVMVCDGQLIFLVLCKKLDFLSLGYWWPLWGHWPRCGYTAERPCLPILPWSWLFPGTLFTDRVPWQTLTEWSGCPPLCVRIPVYLRQRKVCQTSGIWLSCERWLFFFEALPRMYSLVCQVLFMSMSPVK